MRSRFAGEKKKIIALLLVRVVAFLSSRPFGTELGPPVGLLPMQPIAQACGSRGASCERARKQSIKQSIKQQVSNKHSIHPSIRLFTQHVAFVHSHRVELGLPVTRLSPKCGALSLSLISPSLHFFFNVVFRCPASPIPLPRQRAIDRSID